jgi:serine/threonine-protein kinase HipA
VNGKFDGIDRDDLLAFARAEGIKDAAETIDKVADSVSLWPRIAMDCGVPKVMVETIVKNMVLL